MSTIQQIPGELNIEVGLGDDLSLLVDFSINLTGYTFEAKVIRNPEETATTVTVANTDLSAGQITLTLTDAQITAIGTGIHKWYLIWTTGSVSRRVLAGNFIVKAYPR